MAGEPVGQVGQPAPRLHRWAVCRGTCGTPEPYYTEQRSRLTCVRGARPTVVFHGPSPAFHAYGRHRVRYERPHGLSQQGPYGSMAACSGTASTSLGLGPYVFEPG